MAELRDIGVNPVWAEGEKITHAGEWDGDENCPFYGSLR